jgi:hypothetical protein
MRPYRAGAVVAALALAVAAVATASLVARVHGTGSGAGPVPEAAAAASATGGGTSTEPTPTDPASTAASTASGTAAPTGASSPRATRTAPFTDVVLAAGVREYLHCRGTAPPGAPTVVVVSDLGVSASTWTVPTAPVEAATRVCVYDRPGVGLSPPRTSPNQVVDAGLNARELLTLLATAHQDAPYLLVGQGYGTLVARAFARQHPALVRGLLLGGDAPAADGVFWTEAGHRVGVASSTSAAGPLPEGPTTATVVIDPASDPATLVADLRGLVQQLAG